MQVRINDIIIHNIWCGTIDHEFSKACMFPCECQTTMAARNPHPTVMSATIDNRTECIHVCLQFERKVWTI